MYGKPFKMKSQTLIAGTKGAPIQASYSPTKFIGGKHGLLQTVKRVGKKILGLDGDKKSNKKSKASSIGTIFGATGGLKSGKPKNVVKPTSSDDMFSTKYLNTKLKK
tara:strand:- start:494 stop:814 length:321 start_codon:yes stop_codon:yes gene_type:complete